mmetsp:Transcript_36335/g.87669  ORF Transcript_36335/g.87669 Transcript_36335/m.87669 type:complete len:597 (-) Transcript_36335:212-2002(-)
MSKQLLHAYRSRVVVVALNDRAFVMIKDESSTSPATVLELMAVGLDGDAIAAGAAKKDGGDRGDNDENCGKSKQHEEGKDQKKKKKGGNQDTGNPREIQSVRCTEMESHLWLAVSREDKTLSLYSVKSANLHHQSVEAIGQIYPTITYSLPRRARCLAFCSVPSTSSPNGNDCHVIVAGDLSGDATAFPVPAISSESLEDRNAGDELTPTATVRRLLLGHTASIITGLNVVPTTQDDIPQCEKKQLVLTADRDEKIRVSCFPKTHIIHGYLLGHTSFISTMDAAMAVGASSDASDSKDDTQGRALCITGSGDGTVRLWDYQLCKEVGMVPVVIKKCSEDDKKGDGDDVKMPAEEKGDVLDVLQDDLEEEGEDDDENFDVDEDFTDDESINDHAIATPLSVALSSNADNVIVARDGISSIDVHPIPPPPSKYSSSSISRMLSQCLSLHKKQTLECSSQPLAVRCLADGSVLALTREPDYLCHYQRSEGKATEAAEYMNISSTSPFSTALQKAVKSQNIVMPATTLERDEDGDWKLQKNKVHDHACDKAKHKGDDEQQSHGLHWNAEGRKETAKLAEQRRRKRRRAKANEEDASSCKK